MEAPIIPILFMLTAFAVIVWAWMSKRATEQRMDDPDAPKSTLAKDAPDH
ncbi:hypothetical protein [uncultured Tateyamaria sp.]|nr:hypothetical protein [uncultured Tateyamaria sp.]